MNLLLYTLLICFYVIFDIHAIEDALYAPNDFPNPQLYPNPCSHGPDNKSKWLCDPFQYLDAQQQSNLELICETIAKGDIVQSPCASSLSPGFQVLQYIIIWNYIYIQVGIVINKKILKMNDDRKYAKTIFNNWGIGHADCNDGILIYLGIEDRKIEIITGKTARKYLSDNE